MTSRLWISVGILIIVQVFHHHVQGTESVTSWMRQTLTNHFSQTRHHVINSDYKSRAREFIEKELEDMGLHVFVQSFDTRLPNVTGRNVIGVLKGPYFNTTNDTMVAIGAHYDTMRNTPGVNDNGAGVVTMLQAARQLSADDRNGTVLFIAFDLEESEDEADAACSFSETLCGSKKLVSDWLPTFPAWPTGWKGIAVMDTMFNFDDKNQTQNLPEELETVFGPQVESVKSDNRQGDFLTVAGRTQDDELVALFNKSWYSQGELEYEIEIFKLSPRFVQLVPDFTRSDHDSFWKADAAALFLTDTANFRGYMQQCYHEACDNITYVTQERLEFAEKTAGALVSWVDSLAPKLTMGTSGAGRPQPLWNNMTTAVAAAYVVILILRQHLRQLVE